MIELRSYQLAAKESVYRHFRTRSDSPLVVIPTGGGSTAVIAAICHDVTAKWKSRVLVVAPTSMGAAQVATKLSPGRDVFGLTRSEPATKYDPVIVAAAGIGESVADLGEFDVVLLVKAHLIEPQLDRNYADLIATARRFNPRVRVAGFSAIPDRLRIGPVCTAEPLLSAGGLFDHICYDVGVCELIAEGYLPRLITKAPLPQVPTMGLAVYRNDFVVSNAIALTDQPEFVEATCAQIVSLTQERQAVLILAPAFVPSSSVLQVLRDMHGIPTSSLASATFIRPEQIAALEQGQLKFLVAEDLAAAGFGASHFDCVVPLWPTLSRGLYSYMVMQGMRPHAQKRDCLVLDFVGNSLRHGPVDQLVVSSSGAGKVRAATAPSRVCRSCRSVFIVGTICVECGGDLYLPQRERTIVDSDSIRSSAAGTSTLHTVSEITYEVHTKRDAPLSAPKTMRVAYRVENRRWYSEFICLEHSGPPRERAVRWWQQRSHIPVPSTANGAVEIARAGGLAHTVRITVRTGTGERYGRIVEHVLIMDDESQSENAAEVGKDADCATQHPT